MSLNTLTVSSCPAFWNIVSEYVKDLSLFLDDF